MTRRVSQGDLLWTPSESRSRSSRMAAFMRELAVGGRTFGSYEELWAWSTRDLDGFWSAAWDHLGVRASTPPERVLASRAMPGARWFPGARLNYAEHALARAGDAAAIVAGDEAGGRVTWSRDRLRDEVRRIAAALREFGVGPGDRVGAYLPNAPEAIAAFLATASVGAIWSSCSPDFGAASVLDRFAQIEPKVLFATTRSVYAGKTHDRTGDVRRIAAGLPTLVAVVLVGEPGSPEPIPLARRWESLAGAAPLVFEQVPFEHPLWILYSSGTTGLPKPIVQGHGGILLEHLKAISLHCDLGDGDRFFWFTTTGWMMWNFLVSGLLVGSTIVLWDGSPAHPDLGALWRFAEEARLTYFGTSAPYLLSCQKAGLSPKTLANLEGLRGVGSTGAPLPPEGFAWVYDHVSADVLLGSVSGGTDACTAFVLSCPLLPVHAGEIQCRGLGAAVAAYDENGESVIGRVGELVITEPLPSMPTCFWNDPDGSRLHESYFSTYPGVWRHGDWIEITERGSCIITGRSDSTLNRAGVRMGTSEFYRVVESLPEIADSLVVDTGRAGKEDKLWLFIVTRDGRELDGDLVARLKKAIRAELSPRHVPDEIRRIAAVPRTLNGKKLEIPVKKILLGMPPDEAANPDTLANPASLRAFEGLAG